MDGAVVLLVIMLAAAIMLGMCLTRVRVLSKEVEQLKATSSRDTDVAELTKLIKKLDENG